VGLDFSFIFKCKFAELCEGIFDVSQHANELKRIKFDFKVLKVNKK
jgi:hypothetical protein